MPKASPIQPSFSGGEFSPKVYGRVDNERYKTGVAKALNFIPTTQGPMIRRPGTKYSGADAKDPSKPPALIPFQFSQTQNYVLEFGNSYIRFFTNGGQIVANSNIFMVSGNFGRNGAVLTNLSFAASRPDWFPGDSEGITASSVVTAGTILELSSPYLQADVSQIRFAQKDDTLYLVHPNYAPYKLQRFSNYHWTLKPVFFQDGPYLPYTSYDSIADSTRVTLTPSNVGVPTISTGPSYSIYGTANNGQGAIRITTNTSHVFATGDKVCVRAVAGTVEANNGTSSIAATYWPVSLVDATHFDLMGSTFTNPLIGSTGVVSPALFQMLVAPTSWGDASSNQLRKIALIQSGTRYWGTITGVQNAATAFALMDVNLQAAAETKTWQLGAWSSANGFPSAVCFHQDRLFFGGTANYPQRIDSSKVGDYENFAPTSSSVSVLAADNALSFNLLADQQNKVQWLKSDTHGLLAGTTSSEWNISPSNQAGPLTPVDISAKQMSFFGSDTADAIQTGNATLYVQNGQQSLRELNYFYQVDTYRSTDIAELADHLMLPGIQKVVNQKSKIPLVWGQTTDGKLRSMTYSRDDANLKVGWAQHQLGGQSDPSGTAPVIKGMTVVTSSSGTFDQLWTATQRYINGTTVCNIEYMTKIFDDGVFARDAICLDLSGTYDNPIPIIGVSRAGSAIVTATAHGLIDGDQIKINSVVGLNSSFVDTMGVTFNSNLVNGHLFRVGSSSTNAFFLQDINNGSSYIDSRSYVPYFSGGEARKLVQTISGLNWLKSETVSILADGKDHPQTQVNSAGVLALQYKAAVVQIGYAYNSDGQTLRPEAGAGDGTSIGKLRRPVRAAFMLHRAGEMSMGPSFDKLTPLNFDNLDQPQTDVAKPLFSGIVRESVESEHNFEGQVCFRMSSPLPGMVQTVTVMLEEDDV